MSQGNSDPLFDSADFGAPLEDFGNAEAVVLPDALPPSRQVAQVQQVHGFTIYTVLLYISFLMLTVASIIFFMQLRA